MSVRPLLCTNVEAAHAAEPGAPLVVDDALERDGVEDLQGHAIPTDPIVDREVTIMDGNGPGAPAVRPLPSPQQPS